MKFLGFIAKKNNRKGDLKKQLNFNISRVDISQHQFGPYFLALVEI
jgi:hypothetical protein